MPVTDQPIAISGMGPTDARSFVIVDYDQNQYDYGLPDPNPIKHQDKIPGFMFLMGSVEFAKDNQGNVIARNPSKASGQNF